MDNFICEYIELLIESDQIRVSLHNEDAIFPSFEHLMRIEYLDYRMAELYERMKMLGMKPNKETAESIMRVSAAYRNASN